jgi:3-oxoacyl-[acyl-carrier protein] reductase/2-hydroxycyclohexanecarboxyl-CoA dehydrogenase
MVPRFREQVVIVTGGSRGIGLAAAQALADEEAVVIIASVNEERGRKAVDSIKNKDGVAEFIQTDVSDQKQVAGLVAGVMKRHSRIDVLVNNAGIFEGNTFCEETEELWNRVYRVNVLGTVLPSQAVVPHMRDAGGGVIVNLASKAGVVGEAEHAAYCASKGAVIALTRSMAVELAPFGIRVNAVSPGPVETDMIHNALSDELIEVLADEAPLGRIGRSMDIARTILYMASSDSDWCTGQSLSVDGGLSILK